MAAFLDPENEDLSDKLLGRIQSRMRTWLRFAIVACPVLKHSR